MPSSEMFGLVALVRTDDSLDRIALVIRVTRIGEIVTTLVATSNRSTLRRNTIYFHAPKHWFLQEPEGRTRHSSYQEENCHGSKLDSLPAVAWRDRIAMTNVFRRNPKWGYLGLFSW
jgi:hypothetical protein